MIRTIDIEILTEKIRQGRSMDRDSNVQFFSCPPERVETDVTQQCILSNGASNLDSHHAEIKN